jgi:L-serine/L-threonine ammonia-lyase
LACVSAALILGQLATIVVPTSTSEFMMEKIKAAGGSVVQHGLSWQEADEYTREIQTADPHGVYCPAFDHPDVWAGASTMVPEIRKQIESIAATESDPEDSSLASNGADKPDLIICSVGGGGLFSGIMLGVQQQEPSWEKSSVKVLAIETIGADSLCQSVDAGQRVTLPGITSIATSLGARRVAERAFDLALEGKKTGAVKTAALTDAEAALGSVYFADYENILVEASCGVSVAACCSGRLKKFVPSLTETSKVVLIVCGGNLKLMLIESFTDENFRV